MALHRIGDQKMENALRTRIVRIGNSQGIRIPKPLLEQAGISDRVDLVVRDGQISIRPARRAREGWEEQFARMSRAGDDRLLDEPAAATVWDAEEWEW
jgi:antitoxin MazE